eukprot:4528985-Amphidinium_carterae.1
MMITFGRNLAWHVIHALFEKRDGCCGSDTATFSFSLCVGRGSRQKENLLLQSVSRARTNI